MVVYVGMRREKYFKVLHHAIEIIICFSFVVIVVSSWLLMQSRNEFNIKYGQYDREINALFDYLNGMNKHGQKTSSYNILDDISENTIILDNLVSKNVESILYSKDLVKKEKWLFISWFVWGVLFFILTVVNKKKLNISNNSDHDKSLIIETYNNRLFALDMAQDGILIADNSGNLSYINNSLCIINGIMIEKRALCLGRNWLDIFSDSDREIIEEDILPSIIETGNWKGEFLLYRLDNSVVSTDMSFTKLPNDAGIIGTIQDISDQKKSEDEKNMLEEQFYQSQKMDAIGRLAGGIAHDFNNILAAMNGYAEFLIEDLEDRPEQQAFAQNILQAGLQARNQVDQMLAFSRTGDSTLETLNIIETVSESILLLRATLSKSIELRDNFSVPTANIIGNATQISQLVMNLCVNARDAMEDNHGYLDIEIQQKYAEDVVNIDELKLGLPDPKETPTYKIIDLDDGLSRLTLGHLAIGKSYVQLSVRDTGGGMSRVVMERIFEPFFTTKSVDKGTGLGLATVLGIVATHQGFLVINSALGKGTCFDVYFPLDDGSESKDSDNEVLAESKNTSIPTRKLVHVLLVEDQDDVRETIEEILRRIGHEVSSVNSGLEGLDAIRENPTRYDLILTDHNMPKMTGLELAQQVYLDLPNLPFIMLSGYSEEKLQKIINGHPAIKALLHKPIMRGKLDEGIQNVVNNVMT